MKLETLLLSVTAFAVVGDSLLIPFYPQFFSAAFGVHDPKHTGAYLAASCLVVMLAFPAWAHRAERVPTLRLLVPTQFGAGLLALLCWRIESLSAFWIASLGMLALKASYLLIYPYLMSRGVPSRQVAIATLLSVIVQVGSIFGAVLAGAMLQGWGPRDVFVLMACADFAQMLACWVGLRRISGAHVTPERIAARRPLPARVLVKLGLVMFTYYASLIACRPFFASHWQAVSGSESEVASGVAFAVPAAAALGVLWVDHRREAAPPSSLGVCLLLVAAGALLQGSSEPVIVLVGRALFGWFAFRATIRLDLLMFERSSPGEYTGDFSKLYFFQSAGALTASLVAGALVAGLGTRAVFWVAGAGMLLTLALTHTWFGGRHPDRARDPGAAPSLTEEASRAP